MCSNGVQLSAHSIAYSLHPGSPSYDRLYQPAGSVGLCLYQCRLRSNESDEAAMLKCASYAALEVLASCLGYQQPMFREATSP